MLVESKLTEKEIEEIKQEVNTDFAKVEVNESEIKVNYEDAYDIERIYLSKTQNEYGVKFYRLEIEYAQRDNEIHNCYSCHDYFCEDCPLKDKDSDEIIQKEVEEHESRESIKLSGFDELVISPAIVETQCYVDIPHKHLFKGVYLTFETQDFENVLAVLKLRNLLYKLIKCD